MPKKEGSACLISVLVPAAGVFVGTLLYRGVVEKQLLNWSSAVQDFLPKPPPPDVPVHYMNGPEMWIPVCGLVVIMLGPLLFDTFRRIKNDDQKK